MYYFVTYAVQDGTIANPLWHTFLLLSILETGKKLQVIDSFGFYPLPSRPEKTCLSQTKALLGLKVDLQGNHGILKREELRDLDLGKALHGVTYQISEDQWLKLQNKCQTIMAEQESAIEEAATELKLTKQPQYKYYPYEKEGLDIFRYESTKAKDENRVSRLKRFDFTINLTMWGPSLQKSNSCKSQVLTLLSDILTDKQLQQLSGWFSAIPRSGGPLEKIYLHSEGPLSEHKKSSGNIVKYRKFMDKGVTLHWTLPPQQIESNNPLIKNIFCLDPIFTETIKPLIQQLQCLEWLFINAEIPAEYSHYKNKLIQDIHEHYIAFAIIPSCNLQTEKSLLTLYLPFIMQISPVSAGPLIQAIKSAKNLINNVYFAIADQWQIESKPLKDKISDEDNNEPPIEAVAHYLNRKDQESACSILGRSYSNDQILSSFRHRS
jgi:hypothetical protein